MAKFAKWAGYVLAFFMIAMGAMKFFGDVPIFQLLEENLASRYGLALGFVEPQFKYLTASLEIIAGLLLIFGRRVWGALLSTLVIGGAILSHIFVLGISTPMSSDPNASESPMLFIMAVMFFMIAVFVWYGSKSEAEI
jgi:hypothetical protein